jgi:hypothetical protein
MILPLFPSEPKLVLAGNFISNRLGLIKKTRQSCRNLQNFLQNTVFSEKTKLFNL